MSYTIRVYPQPGSIGARRNRAIRQQQAREARFNRLQAMQLRRQLATTYAPVSCSQPSMYGGNFVGQYSPQMGYNPYQSAYNQGIGYGFGSLGTQLGSVYNNPFQQAAFGSYGAYSPYAYAGLPTAFSGVSNLFGGLYGGIY